VNDIQKIQEFVEEHPKASFSEAKKALNLKISDVTYYKWRKIYRKRKNSPKSDPTIKNEFKTFRNTTVFDKMTAILPANPSLGCTEARRKHGIKLSGSTFKRYKEAILTGQTTTKARKNVYMSVFSAPTDSVPPGAKNLLRDFVNALNVANRTNMEVVEYIDPKVIEVRERT